MASGEFGFTFSFEGAVKDDVRLATTADARPRFFLLSIWYRGWIDTARKLEPDVYRHVQTELARHHHEVFHNLGYTIYERW